MNTHVQAWSPKHGLGPPRSAGAAAKADERILPVFWAFLPSRPPGGVAGARKSLAERGAAHQVAASGETSSPESQNRKGLVPVWGQVGK